MASLRMYKENPDNHILRVSRLEIELNKYQTFSHCFLPASPICLLVPWNNERHYHLRKIHQSTLLHYKHPIFHSCFLLLSEPSVADSFLLYYPTLQFLLGLSNSLLEWRPDNSLSSTCFKIHCRYVVSTPMTHQILIWRQKKKYLLLAIHFLISSEKAYMIGLSRIVLETSLIALLLVGKWLICKVSSMGF